MLFASYRHVIGMVISDGVGLIIWVDDIIALVVGKTGSLGKWRLLTVVDVWKGCSLRSSHPSAAQGEAVWCC